MNPDAFANPGRFSPSFDIPLRTSMGRTARQTFRTSTSIHCSRETPRSPPPDLTTWVSKGQAKARRNPASVRSDAGVDGGTETGARRGNNPRDCTRLSVPAVNPIHRAYRTSLLTRAGSRTPRGPGRRAPWAGCPSASRAGRHCPWMRATPETKHAASASSRRACSVLMRFRDRGVASRKTPPRSPGVLNRKLSISDAVYSR